jgi:FkbM family methyltransferase
MILGLKNLFTSLFLYLGFRIIRKKQDKELRSYISDLEIKYRKIQPYFEKFLIVDRTGLNLWKDFHDTNSQFGQETFVLAILDWKRGGFFVEFGALDGVTHSNTLFLEKKYGWNGLLAEPAQELHEALKLNRNCAIDERAVWNESGRELNFRVTNARGLSTLDSYWNSDGHASLRQTVDLYPVKTVSLVDLLDSHLVPKEIDYMSIDTEGSELDIIREFPFDKYNISIITIEHNYSENREKICDIMRNNSYVRVFEDLSKVDDWYVKADLAKRRIFRNSEIYK